MANRKRKRKSESQEAVNGPENKPATKVDAAKQEKSTSEPDATPSQTLPKLPSLSRILSVVMLILGIIAVGALFYKVMAGFFVPLFLAALLVVLFRPVHQWFYIRFGRKPRLAALATTFLVLMVVLMPLILVISVATSQFTAMVSHVNFDDLSSALDRARDQVGISLPHAEQFRRLDELTDTLDEPQSESPVGDTELIASIDEATALVAFLQSEVPGPPTAEAFAGTAEAKLEEFRESVMAHKQESSTELIGKLNAEENFHRQSVIASASIRSWMRTLLGGTLRSQVRLLANPSAEDFKNLLKRGRESLQPRFVSLTSATGSYLFQIAIGLVVLVIAVYFFLIDGSAMIHTLMRLSPLDDNYEEQLLLEFDRTSRAVVLASVLSALVQGILAAIAYYFLGFESIILLFLITTMMALVPFLGAASVWAPCALYLGAVEQNWVGAGILALYGATLVSSIDNVIKMYVLHGRSTLHPLFALLSVLGGVKVFGPMGILVGPMVVVFLQTLLEILNHELQARDEEGEAAESS
ncbi:MAG: AI-2E family transporter [Rubripirellula sp.]